MSPNNQKIETDEIDLGEIIRNFWKEKFFILSISLLFSALTYTHIALKPNTFQTTIVLKSIPITLLAKFDDIINIQQQQEQQEQQQNQQTTFASLLEEDFQQKLNSFDNLDSFVKQNNTINSFKTLLKENQISAKDYFINGTSKNRFGQQKDKKNKVIENIYYLNFPKELKGDEFLDKYVLFIFQNSEKRIKNEIVSLLSVKKSRYDKSLLIAKNLNIQEPILQQKLQDRSLFMINEPKELYYSGVKVIQNEIDNLNNTITEAKKLKLDFNPVLDKASKPINISDSPLKFGIFGFIVGLFSSLIYIIIRNVLKAG